MPTAEQSRSGAWTTLALAWGWLFSAIGAGAASITVARGDYQDILLIALGSAFIAAGLFFFAFLRGGILIRTLSAAGGIPLLFIISEFLSRYKF